MEPATVEAVSASEADRDYEIDLYLTRVFGDMPAAAVEVLGGNWLTEARNRNREAMRRWTKEILRRRNIAEIAQVSPNLAMRILSPSQDESRPELIELWARLLANALDPLRSNVRQSFIDTVKQLDPQDVRIIKKIVYRGYRAIHDGPASRSGITIPALASELDTSEDGILVALDHLARLGVLAYKVSGSLWQPTHFGRELLRACYRYR